MRQYHFFIFFNFCLIFIIVISFNASAFGIGASPGNLHFSGLEKIKTISIINPNPSAVSYKLDYNNSRFFISRNNGEIGKKSKISLEIWLKDCNHSFHDIISAKLLRNNSDVVPEIFIQVYSEESIKKVKKPSGLVYRVEKVIDYNSLKDYSLNLITRSFDSKKYKTGLMIILIEIFLILYIYKRFNKN